MITRSGIGGKTSHQDSKIVSVKFFSVLFTTLLDQAVCHIYKWVQGVRGILCNHCDQLMDGRSLEDVIRKHNPLSLTEDDVNGFLHQSDSDHGGWDDERISSGKLTGKLFLVCKSCWIHIRHISLICEPLRRLCLFQQHRFRIRYIIMLFYS